MQRRGKPGGRWILAVPVLAALACTTGCAQPDADNRQASNQSEPKQERTVDEATRAGLAAFKELTQGDNARSLGLTPGEGANATLGQQYEVFTVGLDQLRAYRPGVAAASLLNASPNVVIPILVNGQVRSSMTITRTEQGYVASEIGGAGLMQATARAAERTPGDFLVRVPALGLQFVGHREGDRVMLSLTTPDPRLKLQPGAPMPADQVLQQLVPIAQAYNGEPM